jgi:transcriptional regulator with XRE-family HTH domain
MLDPADLFFAGWARAKSPEGTAMKRRGREKKEGLNDVDVFVGQRLRELRMLAGLSQSDVAAALGLTFQQLQKYERGFNRVSSSRLFKLGQFFRVPVSVFFDGLESRPATADAEACVVRAADSDTTLGSREALMLARYFQSIPDPHVRAAILELAERCADQTPLEGGAADHADDQVRAGGTA